MEVESAVEAVRALAAGARDAASSFLLQAAESADRMTATAEAARTKRCMDDVGLPLSGWNAQNTRLRCPRLPRKPHGPALRTMPAVSTPEGSVPKAPVHPPSRRDAQNAS